METGCEIIEWYIAKMGGKELSIVAILTNIILFKLIKVHSLEEKEINSHIYSKR